MHKRLAACFTVIVCFCLQLHSQELIRNYVKSSSVRLSAIDPDSTGYTDLEPIGRAIGDARVVMLGEQDHGDAPAFLAKSRLIKYLHEKKGFNVLAFESDFFGLNYPEDHIAPDSLIRQYVFTIWTACKTCSQLFYYYIPATWHTGTPLRISGFDNQMGQRRLMPALDSVLRELKLPVTREPGYASELSPLLLNWYLHVADTVLNNKYLALLSKIRAQLGEKLSAGDFWCMIADNLLQENIQIQYMRGPVGYNEKLNTRDRQMALNLRWICERKYPSEKIIVWAHNYHVSKYGGHYKEGFANSTTSMGTYFTGDSTWLRQTYIIGFTSYGGTAGRLAREPKVYKVNKPLSNSFENWIDNSWEYAFTDLRPFTAAHPDNHELFNMSGGINNNQYHKNFMEEWNRIFDGVIYIKNMYSCVGL